MALPPSFQNSFWTSDYRLDKTLWPKLRAGIVENQEILRLVTDRANIASDTSKALYSTSDARLKNNGFAHDEGASLRRTFEGLKDEARQVAKAHETVATNLDHMVLRPFTTWSHAHEGRVTDLIDQLDSATKDWETLSHEVRKLKEARNAKCSLLDDAEEDLRFAPTSPSSTSNTPTTAGPPRGRSESGASTSSQSGLRWDPSQAAHAAQQATTAASNLARSLTQRVKVTPTAHAVKTRFERMRAEAREKELASRGQDPDFRGKASALLEKEELLDEEGGRLGKNEKQAIAEAHLQPALALHGKDDTKVQIDQLEIAGVVKHPKDWSIIFAKAKMQIPTTAVKVPLIGTTPDAHSGEDLVLWFKDNLDDLGSSLSRSHEFCRQLSEELAILRLVGEIGNKFFDSSDAFYAWRPEAFQLDDVQNQINDAAQKADKEKDVEEVNLQAPLTELPAPMKERRSPNSPLLSPKLKPQALPTLPMKNGANGSDTNGGASSPPTVPTSPRFASGLSRSNTISSYLSSAYERAASNVSSLNAKVAKVAGTGATSERLDRLKKDALDAEDDYRIGVQDLEDARLRLEELFSSTLARAQKLELDRLKAIKSVITTYNGTLAAMNTPLQLSSERSALLSEAFVPLSDLNTTIEQYKTGTFRPRPNVWTDFYHETTDVRFGVDLKHWYDMNSESGPSASNQKIPDVLEQLLDTLRAGYPNLKDDAERRRTWIYEVPLPYTHRLRNLLNVAGAPLPLEELRGFDLPVLASCVKLYLLELAISVIPSNLYQDVKTIYPTVGADSLDQETRTKGILELLDRVPKVHLVVLDALLVHLNDLVVLTASSPTPKEAESAESTAHVESDAEFVAKLGATLGPCILRPPIDSNKTLNDRFPTQLFVDLLRDYADLLPPTLLKKSKVEEKRYAPKRQRTKMVDERVTRSTTTAKDNRKHSDWLKEELERKMGHRIAEEPDKLPPKDSEKLHPTANRPSDMPAEAPEVPVKSVQTEASVARDSSPEKEQLEIPPAPGITRTASAISENHATGGERTPGFVTPTEQPGSPETGALATNEAETPASPATAETKEVTQKGPVPIEEELAPTSPEAVVPTSTAPGSTGGDSEISEQIDENKPLVASSSLARSPTGSSARRAPGPLSRSGATRGPRPMSMHGPQSSAGGSTSSTSASTAAGVRARAAMFEQRSAPSPK